MDVFGILKKGADALKVAKDVFAKLEILLEDADHNGKPDIQDAAEGAIKFASEKGKAHFEALKLEGKELAELLKQIKAKLDEIKPREAKAK